MTTLTKFRTVEALDEALLQGGTLVVTPQHSLKLGDATVYWAAWAKWVERNGFRVTATQGGYEVAPW